MDLNRLKAKAKSLFEQRGGSQALKEDAQELKDIATGPGSLTDKGKAAMDAIKEPGARGGGASAAEPESAPADAPSQPEPPAQGEPPRAPGA